MIGRCGKIFQEAELTGLRFDRLAFIGGGLINQVGSLNDVICFFKLIKQYAAPALDETDRILLLDRLYKRYLRIEGTLPAIDAMRRVEHRFTLTPSSIVYWDHDSVIHNQTALRLDGGNLSDVFLHFFERFYECANAAIYLYHQTEHGFFSPVKICRSDFGSLDREDTRPLEEYENLDGLPFWVNGN
jgi:hypothetical protein